MGTEILRQISNQFVGKGHLNLSMCAHVLFNAKLPTHLCLGVCLIMHAHLNS